MFSFYIPDNMKLATSIMFSEKYDINISILSPYDINSWVGFNVLIPNPFVTVKEKSIPIQIAYQNTFNNFKLTSTINTNNIASFKGEYSFDNLTSALFETNVLLGKNPKVLGTSFGLNLIF